jgi:hypothetical protein
MLGAFLQSLDISMQHRGAARLCQAAASSSTASVIALTRFGEISTP